MQNRSNSKLLKAAFAVMLVGIAVFAIRSDNFKNFLKENVNEGKIQEVIDTIHKEVVTPGALVARIESENALLTKFGTFSFTNAERTNAGLTIFSANANLDRIAKLRADDMFAKQYFEHVSPSGESAGTIAEDIGYEYILIGENIALGNFENDETLVRAWMESPGHRANILNSKFTELGISVVKGEYKGKATWIGVQIFARPMASCTKVDEGLKRMIDNETRSLEVMQGQIAVIEAELERLSENKRSNREEYNQKVDEYNALANQINSTVANLKQDISSYNAQVRSFNACINSQ